MKKLSTLLPAIFLVTITTIAKAQQTASSLEIQRFQRPAMYFETDGNAGDIEDMVINYFKAKGFKKEKVKGGLIKFTNVRIEKVPATLDYYFNIEAKGKKKDGMTSVWFATSSGVDVFTDTSKTDNWKYMGDFVGFLKTTVFPYYSIDGRVSDKMKEIKNSKGNLDDLLKKKQKLEKEIDDTNKEIDQQQKELGDLNTQKEVLQKNL